MFEFVYTESRASSEVMFGSIFHDGSRGSVLEEDIVSKGNFCGSSEGKEVGGRRG